MSDKPVMQKLLVKPGRTLAIENAPEGSEALLGALPEGAGLQAGGEPDILLLFLRSREEMERLLPPLTPRLKPGGILWVLYPKGTSKTLKADIHRDSINAYAKTLGLEGVAMISINEDWSALRLKTTAQEAPHG